MDEITNEELKRDREYLDHHEPIKRKVCSLCGQISEHDCMASLLDGKYHICETCTDRSTEIMDEIDTARRRAVMDLEWLIRMCTGAVSTNDMGYAKGVIVRSIEWVKLDPKDRIKKIAGGKP